MFTREASPEEKARRIAARPPLPDRVTINGFLMIDYLDAHDWRWYEASMHDPRSISGEEIERFLRRSMSRDPLDWELFLAYCKQRRDGKLP